MIPHKHNDDQEIRTYPLRTFSDQAPKRRSPYLPEIELCWYFLAPLLIIAAITGVGIYAAKVYQSKTPGLSKNADQHVSFLTENDRVSKEAFLKAYLEAKGLETNNSTKPIFHFRGNYIIGNKMAAFTGESDAFGNGCLELSMLRQDDPIQFRNGDLQSEPAKAFVEETLAIHSLAACFEDPLYALALSPDDYEAEMHGEKEFGLEAIIVNLVHKPSSARYTISVDANDLRIKKIIKSVSSGQLALKFQGYLESDGVRLPTKVFASDGTGMTLPIDFSEIDIAHNQPNRALIGKATYE